MKQLELNLNKILLIVEYETEAECAVEWALMHAFKNPNIINHGHKVKPICGGSDLTEDIAKGFLHQSIHTGLFAHYVKVVPVNIYCYKTALEAFNAAIYAYGWHWEKPLGISTEEIRQKHGDASDMFNEWLEYEKTTFNPEKCIIFEIL